MEKIKDAKYSAMDFAKFIINFCTSAEISISDLKLQKILYFIQLYFIRDLKRYAFSDEIVAWKYGPVIKNVYNVYSSYGSTKICLQYDKLVNFDENERNIIYSVLIQTIPKDVWDLVEMTHIKGGPWDQVYDERKEMIIKKESMAKYALSV